MEPYIDLLWQYAKNPFWLDIFKSHFQQLHVSLKINSKVGPKCLCKVLPCCQEIIVAVKKEYKYLQNGGKKYTGEGSRFFFVRKHNWPCLIKCSALFFVEGSLKKVIVFTFLNVALLCWCIVLIPTY